MRPLQMLTLVCGVIVLSVAAARTPAPEADGRLAGVSVDALWQATNFINPEFLTGTPTFVRDGDNYVGTASMNALRPNTNEPIGVDITWTISLADAKALAHRTDLPIPSDAQYVVVGHFNYVPARTEVDAFSVVSVRNGSLVPRGLGLRKADGSSVPATADLARSVFGALGIRGPYTNRIVIEQ